MPYLNRFAESKVLLISFFTTLASSGHFLRKFFWQRSIVAQESFDVDAIKLEIQSIGYPFSDIFKFAFLTSSLSTITEFSLYHKADTRRG